MLEKLAIFVLGWLARVLYDWKIQPTIMKSRRRAEKKGTEQEKKQEQERETLKRSWENNTGILRSLKGPIKELTQISSFPDKYTPEKCVELLSFIESAAEQLEPPEFLTVRERLLKFASKKTDLLSSTLLVQLMNMINGKYDRLSPWDLLNEIDAALKNAPAPPLPKGGVGPP